MPSTYDLLTAADRFMAESGDLEPEAFDAAMAEWLGDSGDKARRIAALRTSSLSRAAMHRGEAFAHDLGRKRHEGVAERCDALILLLLTKRRELGEPAVIDGVARLQKNGGKVPLLLTGPVPDAWTVTTTEPDKERIREALEAGTTIPGAALGERGEGIRWSR